MILNHVALLLDLSDMDTILLNYVERLNEVYHFKSLTLVHFVEVTEFPKEIVALFPDLKKPVESVIELELMEQMERCSPNCSQSGSVYVHGGGKIEEFLDWMNAQDFDLVVVGKKSLYHGSGIFSGKIVRLTDCNTLFVTEMARGDIYKVMIPIDFSVYTQNALKLGQEIGTLLKAELLPVHVIKVGMQYFPLVKNRSELYAYFEKEAKTRFEKYRSKLKLTEDCFLLEGDDQHLSKMLYEKAISLSIDLIVVGAKGKADDSDLLIGSVAERLIASEKNIPVLIVRKS